MKPTKPKPIKAKELPDKLSALILVALADLTKAEQSPLYKIDMTVWHSPNSHCSVCFAGAVLAFSLGFSPQTRFLPTTLPKTINNKLFALDTARTGSFGSAIYYLLPSDHDAYDKAAEATKHIVVPSYSSCDRGFKSAMLKAAKALAAVGL